MITLTAKINILSGKNGALSVGSNNLSGNNISSDLDGILGEKKANKNPFIIGASKIGDGATFSDGVDYFIGNRLSDSNGDFSSYYSLDVSGENLSSLTLAFDKSNKRYPKNIYYQNWVKRKERTKIHTSSSPTYTGSIILEETPLQMSIISAYLIVSPQCRSNCSDIFYSPFRFRFT